MIHPPRPLPPARYGNDLPPPGLVDYGALVAMTLLWGSTFLFTAIALDGYGPGELVAARLLLGGIALMIPALALGQIIRPAPAHLAKLVVLGLLGYAVPFVAIAWAQQWVTSGLAAIFLSTMPLFILVLSRLILKEHVSLRKWAGFGVGLVGLVLLIGPEVLLTAGSTSAAPQLALLLAITCFACSSILVRTLPPMPSMQTTGLALLFGGLALAPFSAASFLTTTDRMLRTARSAEDLIPFGAILFLGIVLAGFGQTIRIHTIKLRGPVFFSITGYMIPLWATVLGVLVLGEKVTTIKMVAFVVIVAGLVLAQSRAAPPPSG
ncbi:DMT family transporter [Mameliella alba]|nr:DMT family transporter [Antarctobacter heliothermus]MBY6145183.1 DMT family transporter [Mameliella alba]MBY6162008.1 DMT family transporter [Mameliella alba]MBY6170478.1 DMT family transporter [Mameliella alba]MBY6175496.1 DMT family transporter [Mameliella alba]